MDPLSLLFPKFCCGCQRIGSFLCGNCYQKIYFLSLDVKPKLETIYLDKLQAMAAYDEPIKSLLHQLKYNHVKGIGELCGQLLFLYTNYPHADVVTCTPLHKKRQQERGYNQAEVMAKEFAKYSGIPFLPLLIKNTATVSQANLVDKSQRLHNLDTVFSLDPKFINHKIQRVIIIDDVTTTGSTLNTCAKILKAWGCQKVYGLAVAHGG